jgi:serine protease Do
MTMEVRVGERPPEVAQTLKSSGAQERGKLGITVENVTPEAARQMKLSSSIGALVTEVRPGSPADDGGIRPGDVVRAVNQTPVNSASDLVAATQNLKSGDTVRLRLERQGKPLFLAFELT